MKILGFLSQNLYWFLGFLGILVATFKAWTLRWLCDDAFFSFIYARNLAEGNGFVFNVGERVEAITNPLWTLLLFISQYCISSMDLGEISIYLGLLFYILLLISILFLERKVFPNSILPVFTLSISSFYHLSVFATSGLETMAFTFFLFWGVVSSLFSSERKISLSLILLSLSGFFRPEGFLFYFLSFIANRKRLSYTFALGAFLILGLGFGLRFYYFGSLLPNTFYAKSGFFPLEGLLYFLQLFRNYPLLIFPFSLAIVSFKKKEWQTWAILVYIVYVVLIGGDFMIQRFWIPILPILFWNGYIFLKNHLDSLQIESNQTNTWTKFLARNISVCYLVYLSSFAIYFPFQWKSEGEISPMVFEQIKFVEERDLYKAELLNFKDYDLSSLKGLRVAFFGAQAHFIYAMRPDFALESETGLTNVHVAMRPNQRNARAGHRKPLNESELEKFNLDLILDNRFPNSPKPKIVHFWRGQTLTFIVSNVEKVKVAVCNRKDWDCSLLYRK